MSQLPVCFVLIRRNPFNAPHTRHFGRTGGTYDDHFPRSPFLPIEGILKSNQSRNENSKNAPTSDIPEYASSFGYINSETACYVHAAA